MNFPGFRVALAIASLPGMTRDCVNELPGYPPRADYAGPKKTIIDYKATSLVAPSRVLGSDENPRPKTINIENYEFRCFCSR